ncbi:MAG: MutS-related protein, partial [Planctomycetota bacterium]
MSDVITECRARLEARRESTARRKRTENRISNARLGVAIIAIAVAVAPGVSWAWLSVPILVFVVLIVRHERVVRARDRSLRAEAFYERGIARLTGGWPGEGVLGEEHLDPEHPCAADLDLFGPGSVFELLCSARTKAGEDTLAAWLQAPASVETLRARQAAVDELRPRLDMREEIALLGDDVRAGIDEASLARWGSAPASLTSTVVPVLAGLLALAACVGVYLALATPPLYLPLAVVVLLELALSSPFRRRVGRVLFDADRPADELDLVSRILARLEDERFLAPHLIELRARLEASGQPPSRRIRRLVRLIRMADWSGNQLFAPIAALLLWNLQIAFAIERWRRGSGEVVGRWIAAMGELEALLSLAGHAFEHPEDPFPELVEGDAVFDGEGVAHPLLPLDRAVRNDVRLTGRPGLLLVSGSNMSGKST